MVNQSYFEACTNLQLNHEHDNRYRECSGKSYKHILQAIDRFNADNSTHIYCYNDYGKDATYIYL